jgi:hypothetical protein
VTVTLTPTDGGSGVAATYFTTDGSTPDQTSPSGTSVMLAADGVYTIRYFSVDEFGNAEPVRTASTPIRIDTGAPVTTDDSASVGNAWKTGAQTVTLTPTDARSGVAATYFTTDGSVPTTSSAQGTTVSLTTTGSYVIRYFSVDAAGNAEPVQTAGTTVRVDTTAPSPIVTFPTDGGRYNSTSWNAGCATSGRLCGSASDPGSGVTNVKVTIRRASDNRYWSGSSWQTSSTSLTASGTTSWSTPLSTSQLANGVTYTVTVKATDAAGNTSSGLANTFTYDTSGPTVSSSGLATTNKNGAVNAGDTLSVTFGEALNPATVPATGTLTLSRASKNTSYGITGLTNGLRDTGATGYVTSNGSTRTVTFAGTLALSNNNRTVTFTVTGPCAGSCSALSTTPRSGSLQFVAAPTLRDLAGNAPSTSSVSASSQVMF